MTSNLNDSKATPPPVDLWRAATDAVDALLESYPDGAEALAIILCRVAARHGSAGWLWRGRSGSWEADAVQNLVLGTVGYDEQYLADYLEP